MLLLLAGDEALQISATYGRERAFLAVLRSTFATIVAVCTLLGEKTKDSLLVLEHLPGQVGFRMLRNQLLG